MKLDSVVVRGVVNADIAKVWDYWTNPIHIVNWNFAADTWCCPSAENDMQVGGKYKARMEAKDGSFGFDYEAIYDEIIPHEKLAYTLLDGRHVQTVFAFIDGQTHMTTTFDPEDIHPVDFQISGWQAILDSFINYVHASAE